MTYRQSFSGLVRIYCSMETKTLTFVAAMLAAAASAYADIDCQTIRNGYGDMNMLTLGGFTLAKPTSIVLDPTNAPAGVRCSVRCQIVYRDNDLPYPKTKHEKKQTRKVGDSLNGWLKDYFSSRYSGMEFVDMIAVYYDGWLSKDVKDGFPEYVATRLEAMGPDSHHDIEIVAVTVNAEDEFKGVLSELWRKRATASQP